jgi:hypothetical protein
MEMQKNPFAPAGLPSATLYSFASRCDCGQRSQVEDVREIVFV